MSDVVVKIDKAVPTTIFELPKIKLRVDTLFIEMESEIKARLKDFIIKNKDDYDKISYDTIVALFKMYFYKYILNEVVEITFTEDGKYDVVANILELLSDERFKHAIWGEPMIYAFILARKLTSDGNIPASLHSNNMLLVEQEFLERTISI